MKTRMLRILLATPLVVAAALSSGGCCPIIGAVFIPDEALELALRQQLNQPFGCLTQADLASITELQAENKGIASLDGLEYCTGLTVLNLRSNVIQSITPLRDLPNLVRVDLTDNAVRNIEPIAAWQNLDELALSGELMEIFDWSPLTANVNATRGLGSGDVVVVPTQTTVGTDGNPLPNFANALQACQAAGVSVIVGDTEIVN